MSNKINKDILSSEYDINILEPDEELVSKILDLDDDLSITQAKIIANRYDGKLPLDKVVNQNVILTNEIKKLDGIEQAGTVIAEHIKNKKRILMVVDFDSDGVNSGAVLYKSFRNVFNYDRNYFEVLVNRRRDGTGFNDKLIEKILTKNKENKIDLIIVADHGSSDKEAFIKLKENGINTILTDHHKIPDMSIEEVVLGFVNPQKENTPIEVKEISGCFVAFLTMLETNKQLTGKYNLQRFEFITSYVAISTITDMMPMSLPINRYIVNKGLTVINSLKDYRWAILKTIMDIPEQIMYKTIAYTIGPLINTGNRVDEEEIPFKFLIATKPDTIKYYCGKLLQLHKHRKKIQKNVLVNANAQSKEYKLKNTKVIEINSELSINGIIAANISNDVKQPTVCFINTSETSQNIITGSCRLTDDELDVVEIFKTINEKYPNVMVKYGGHKQAGGCSIYRDKMEVFKEAFDKIVHRVMKNVPKKKTINVDMIVPDFKLTPYLARSLDNIGGYGKDWEVPTLITILKIDRVMMFNDKMCKIVFKTRTNRHIEVLYFIKPVGEINTNNITEVLKRDTEVIVIYNLHLESFRGVIDFSMNIKDMKIIKG